MKQLRKIHIKAVLVGDFHYCWTVQIRISKFEFQSCYYIHFHINIPNYRLNSITAVFHKDGFGITKSSNFGMPLK